MKAVVDASFLLTLVPSDHRAEPFSAVYPLMRRRFELVAPPLLHWELGNVVHGRHRRYVGEDVEDRRSFQRTLMEGIELFGPDAIEGDTAAIAERFDLTFYDSAYLALAAMLPDAQLLTEDDPLVHAASEVIGPERVWTVVRAIKEAAF